MTKRLKKVVFALLALMIAIASVCVVTNADFKAYADETEAKDTEVDIDGKFEGPDTGKDIFDIQGEYYNYCNYFPAGSRFSAYPMITVFTHGMGSDASVWSNDISADNYDNDNVHFAYDEFSLIERLRCKSNAIGNQVVRAVIRSTPNTPASGNTYAFTLEKVDLIQGANGKAYSGNASALSLPQLDPEKHLIIVYDAECMASASNKEDFYAFSKMLLSVVNTLKDKSDGIYPKVNLIGHSRGGLTNLAFAMAYPELVASLTSIGTPYFGSNFGKIKFLVDTIFEQKDEDITYSKQEAYKSIQNEVAQNAMVSQWNNNYDRRYSNIKLKILGGYSRIIYLKELVDEYENSLPENFDKSLIIQFLDGLKKATILDDAVAGLLTDAINQMVEDAYENDEENLAYYRVTKSEIKKILVEAMQNNEQDKGVGDHFTDVYDDLLVSLNSQLGRIYNGVSYKGFSDHTHCKYFGNIRNIQKYKYAKAIVPVVHNLETRDPFFVNEIVYGNGRANGTCDFGNETDEETDMGIEMGTLSKNRVNAVPNGEDIVSDVVIVHSDMGAEMMSSDSYTLSDADEISLDWLYAQCSMAIDYNTLSAEYDRIEIILSGDVREDDDGYQWVGIFNTDTSADERGEMIAEIRTEHGRGVKDTTWSYTLNADFDLFLQDFPDGKIVLRYRGSGAWLNTWRCRNIKMTVRIYREGV